MQGNHPLQTFLQLLKICVADRHTSEHLLFMLMTTYHCPHGAIEVHGHVGPHIIDVSRMTVGGRLFFASTQLINQVKFKPKQLGYAPGFPGGQLSHLGDPYPSFFVLEVFRHGVNKIFKPWQKLGNCKVNPRGVADLEYKVIGVEW